MQYSDAVLGGMTLALTPGFHHTYITPTQEANNEGQRRLRGGEGTAHVRKEGGF